MLRGANTACLAHHMNVICKHICDGNPRPLCVSHVRTIFQVHVDLVKLIKKIFQSLRISNYAILQMEYELQPESKVVLHEIDSVKISNQDTTKITQMINLTHPPPPLLLYFFPILSSFPYPSQDPFPSLQQNMH